MEDSEIHEGLAEFDRGADLAVQLASGVEMAVSEVVVSGLEVIIDLDVVDDHTLIFDFLALGVKEGVADALKLDDVAIFNNLA